jgi:uncharacterized membrane protein YhaH (DUF805 family)
MGFLFGIEGRLNRGKYWLAGLFYIVATLILAGLFFAMVGGLPRANTAIGFFLIAGAFYLVLFVSAICVAAKRLHDRDKSAWWLLILYIAPAVLGGVGNAMQRQTGSPSSGLAFHLVSLAISIWAFVELGCLRGTSGPNRFGADPLGGG